MIKAVLFDLDGTLLPMDQDEFTKKYFGLLAQRLAPLGYQPRQLVDAIWKGTAAMVKNDGSRPNEAAFWDCFVGIYGQQALRDQPAFDAFYRTDFQQIRHVCGFTAEAAETVRLMKDMGLCVALATNPIFPAIATESRIRWAGLSPEDFALYTTYENTSYCKPNPAYYTDVAARLGVAPEHCLMVGNDATEDTAAQEAGMQVFLLTDCLINREQRDLSACPRGSFAQLRAFVSNECVRGGAPGPAAGSA